MRQSWLWSSGDIFVQSETYLSFGNFDIFIGGGISLFAHALEADGNMKQLRKLADILFGISKVCGTWHKLDASCRRLQSYFCFIVRKKNELTPSFYLFAEVRFATTQDCHPICASDSRWIGTLFFWKHDLRIAAPPLYGALAHFGWASSQRAWRLW